MEKVKSTIQIEIYEGGGFNVIQNEKCSEHLGYDEMLGLVSALTMPESRPCLQWMKTKEGHERSRIKSEFIDGMIKDLDSRVIPIMTHPLSRSWRQPELRKLEFINDYVVMDKSSFNLLYNYESTYPSGVYEGKIWRNGGLLMWYDIHDTNPKQCVVKSRPIAIKRCDVSKPIPKPKQKSLWIRFIARCFNSNKESK